jgi:hypothetical protein
MMSSQNNQNTDHPPLWFQQVAEAAGISIARIAILTIFLDSGQAKWQSIAKRETGARER